MYEREGKTISIKTTPNNRPASPLFPLVFPIIRSPPQPSHQPPPVTAKRSLLQARRALVLCTYSSVAFSLVSLLPSAGGLLDPLCAPLPWPGHVCRVCVASRAPPGQRHWVY
ncbi:hypothetical protein DPEC_G00004780 [Dallia pectoralis]|uniref:Uncharacterized protein n=1 Tax=Dallia pectoralis TaxID=75939 RepID=A0ACC2HKI8_DALPE|nr:hypothetical protein DPEC_G00004780 [Dallia pectoralis]